MKRLYIMKVCGYTMYNPAWFNEDAGRFAGPNGDVCPIVKPNAV